MQPTNQTAPISRHEAYKALNGAAYAALRSARDVTESEKNILLRIARETDHLVDAAAPVVKLLTEDGRAA